MEIYKTIICIIILLIIVLIFYYNRMLSKKNKATNAYSSLDIMLKKRYDLIPNLVKVVKEYSNFEKTVLESVTKLRSDLLSTSNQDEIFEKNNYLVGYLDKIMGYAENNPDLKANKSYIDLQTTLTKLEEHISAARRTYNAHVTNYNNFIQFFPNNLFAKLYGFKKLEWFIFDGDEKVGVDFNEDNR